MNSQIRDLLPDEVDVSTTPLPAEILEFQAQRLEERTKGILNARVLRTTSESEIVLSFEVSAQALDFTSILFKVRHRPELEYPALIVPPDPLPAFLRPTVTVTKVKKGPLGSAYGSIAFDKYEETTEKNHWLAVTDMEFLTKVGEVLRMPQIRSMFASLVSKSNRLAVPKLAEDESSVG